MKCLAYPVLLGKGGSPTATDGVHRAPRNRDLPDRRGHMAGAEGEKSSPYGWHFDRRFCALLDPVLHHRAHRAAVLL